MILDTKFLNKTSAKQIHKYIKMIYSRFAELFLDLRNQCNPLYQQAQEEKIM